MHEKKGKEGESKQSGVLESNQYIEQRDKHAAKGKANSFMAKQGGGSRMLSSLPHFFQPLLPGFHCRFSIPVGFGKYLEGKEVGEGNAVLRSPGGKIYRVKMEKGREFKDGWKEFVDEHDLRVGDMVVFRLVDEPMVFDVMIFDSTACERTYPPNKDVNTEKVVAAAAEEEEMPLPCAADVPEPETELHSIENGSGTPMETIGIGKDGPSEAKKPYFVVSIKPDNLNHRRLHIPRYFSRIHGLNLGHTEGVVLNEEGRSWPVMINCYHKSFSATYIERGWGVFQKENELKLGDTFNLELAQGGQKPVLRMFGRHANPMHEKAYGGKVRKNVKEVRKEPIHDQDSPAAWFSEMADAHFMLTVTSQFLGVLPSIPKKLAWYGGLHGGSRSLILTNEKGRDWLVTVETSTNDVTYIASGWTELVKDNGLSVGDTLRVDLVERGMNPAMTFKVVSRSIVPQKTEALRDASVENGSGSPMETIGVVEKDGPSEAEKPCFVVSIKHDDLKHRRLHIPRPYSPKNVVVKTEKIVAEEEERPLPADVTEPETGLHSIENGSGTPMETIGVGNRRPSEAKKPYFVVSIKPDNLNKRRQRIPKYFSMMYGLHLENTEGVILNEEGRSWPVMINCYCKSSSATYIERGWGVFQKENELKLGDTFNLELVQGGQKPVLRMFGLHANPMLEKAYREKVRKERRKNAKEVKKEPIHDQDSPAAGFSEMVDAHFMLTVTSHFLEGDSLSISKKLARYSGLHGGSRSLILTNEKGREWLVTVETSTNDITYIASGWTEFVKENGLSVGDTLSVDLVERGMNPAMTFKVVSRNTFAEEGEALSDEQVAKLRAAW